MWCLQGNPSDRPSSFKEVLEHPFFSDQEISLPVIRPHFGVIDVMISYQSTYLVMMCRIRHFLRAIGLSTADGTEVALLWAND